MLPAPGTAARAAAELPSPMHVVRRQALYISCAYPIPVHTSNHHDPTTTLPAHQCMFIHRQAFTSAVHIQSLCTPATHHIPTTTLPALQLASMASSTAAWPGRSRDKRCSEMSCGVAPSGLSARSASTLPTREENLKPCPLHALPSTTCGAGAGRGGSFQGCSSVQVKASAFLWSTVVK